MNIRLLMPGKNKERALCELYDHYLERIRPFAKISFTLLREETPSSTDRKNIDRALEKEASSALKLVKDDEFLILSDIRAPELSTEEFHSQMDRMTASRGNLVFYIGSSNGIADVLRERADFAFSLSRLTFTHYHAALILLEQIYRYFLTTNGHHYDK